MTTGREELKKKTFAAASAEEVMEILKAAGEEITAEEAAQLFEKAQAGKTGREPPWTSWRPFLAAQTATG